MQDLKEIKQLCQAHVTGEIDFETYRQKRAKILDSITGVKKALSEPTLQEPASTTVNIQTNSDASTSKRSSGTTIMVIGLISIVLIAAGAFIAAKYLL